ncbi:MAG: ribokinase [Planctomycetaceae bacterium]
MTATGPLAVLGAINVDLVVSGASLPRLGETTVGGTFAQHHGGKGGNQAVAAARAIGRSGAVAMVGAVGDDPLGAQARDALAAGGIDVSRVRTADVATGVALIAVDRTGENQIVVAPGANHAFDDVTDDLDALAPSFVLASAEVEHAALVSAADWCRAHEVAFGLNPAPSSPRLRVLLDDARVATPNRGEVLDLVPREDDPRVAARMLVRRAPGLTVVITLGADGALVVEAHGEDLVDAPQVEAVDTVGAGDCLNGVLAAGLWEGLPMREAVRRAVTAAALSVTVEGAREGMPARGAIDAALAGKDYS